MAPAVGNCIWMGAIKDPLTTYHSVIVLAIIRLCVERRNARYAGRLWFSGREGDGGAKFWPAVKIPSTSLYYKRGRRIWRESLGELKQCPCEKESYHAAGIQVQPMNAIEK